MMEYLLERENIGGEPGALAFVAFDGVGNIGDADAAGDGNLSTEVMVDGDQTGIGGRRSLAILETQVNGQIIA